MQKYSVNQQLIQTLLSWVESGEIAIPEIQRPFVWDSSKVRDLMDSLYQGFPIGYVIVWQNLYPKFHKTIRANIYRHANFYQQLFERKKLFL